MQRTDTVMASSDRGFVPTIACINLAQTPLGVDLDHLVPALQTFVDDCFAPVWGTPAKLIKASKPRPGCWTMVFLESADPKHSRAAGYHQPFFNNMPISKVFVREAIQRGESLSAAACHQVAEMLVDPTSNLWALGRDGNLWAYEVCDAVCRDQFSVDGLAMSNFVYPAYFELNHREKSVQFDHLKKLDHSFQILPTGFAVVRKGRRAQKIFGSPSGKRYFLKHNYQQDRSERRMK